MKILKFVYAIVTACWLLFGGAGQVVAQSEGYPGVKLQNLAESLKADYGLDCRKAKSARIGNHQVVVERDAFGMVNHIGFYLFSRDLLEQTPSPVYRFVERYLLELYQLKGANPMAEQLKEDKVTLQFFTQKGTLYEKLQQTLDLLQRDLPFILTTDNSHYTLLWRKEGKPCFKMRFPIQYELLWGMNKIECENRLYNVLLAFKSPQKQPEEIPDETLLTAEENGCYRYAGDWYEIESVNTDRFYRRTKGGFAPVQGERYPVETVHNLFSLLGGGQLKAHVLQRKYGRKKTEFDLSLAQLLAFCEAEGCEPYTGIESLDSKHITGCVVLLNRSMGYNHVAYFDIPLEALKEGSHASLQLELYAYVPTHNLQNMYEERNTSRRMKSNQIIMQ